MRDIDGAMQGTGGALGRAGIGAANARDLDRIALRGAPRPSKDEEAIALSLLRRVIEQALRNLDRSLRRELRRQRAQQRLAQQRLIEQRRFEQRDIERRKQRAIALGIDPDYRTMEQRKWTSATPLTLK